MLGAVYHHLGDSWKWLAELLLRGETVLQQHFQGLQMGFLFTHSRSPPNLCIRQVLMKHRFWMSLRNSSGLLSMVAMRPSLLPLDPTATAFFQDYKRTAWISVLRLSRAAISRWMLPKCSRHSWSMACLIQTSFSKVSAVSSSERQMLLKGYIRALQFSEKAPISCGNEVTPTPRFRTKNSATN